jgi:hypothetical protein
MRFRLRTLLIVLAVGPIVLAGFWVAEVQYREWRVRQEAEKEIRRMWNLDVRNRP